MAKIKKIMCAVDFSDMSAQVADYAQTMGKSLNASIKVVYLAPSLSQYVGFNVTRDSIDNFVGKIVSGAEKTMDTFIQENFSEVEVSGQVLTGDGTEDILQFADQENIDMIIMGTHGRKGIDRVLFGSMAEKVVKTAKIPVLTIRPK